MTPEQLAERLLEAFPHSNPEVEDLTGTANHYRVSLVSERFVGLTRLQRHRLVYTALGEAMRVEIHALSLDLKTPTEQLG